MDDGEGEGTKSNEVGFQYVSSWKDRRRTRKKACKEDVKYDAEEEKARRVAIIQEKKAYLLKGVIGDKMTSFLDNALSEVDDDGFERKLPDAILMLGLGNVATSKVSQMQLAFLLLIRDRLVDNSLVEAFDPIFNADDQALLESFNIVVQPDNLKGRYHLDKSTFVYMPHCTKAIYENILRANWSQEGLQKLWLCCNELERYTHFKKADDEAQFCIDRIAPYLQVHPLPILPSPHDTALNDLAIQRFGRASLELTRGLDGSPDISIVSFWILPEEMLSNNYDPELL